ncbi:MAG: ATP-binding protein [Marinilabiliaceae bacterium]|nr:ATP-binding protein [Marinilabiliaceae bacterium]
MSKEGKYISNLIKQGEHCQLDFKYAISDSKKIARSIVAFANTIGGRLLIGVKDNGQITGIRSDEEYYMIEGAAAIHCSPPVPFICKEWMINGKSVLEIIIEPSKHKPHTAPNKDGIPKVYIRVKDQNLLANSILLKVWKREKSITNTLIALKDAEKVLLNYLNEEIKISKAKFCKIASINNYLAEKILVNMISANVLKIEFTEITTFYLLKNEGDSTFIYT